MLVFSGVLLVAFVFFIIGRSTSHKKSAPSIVAAKNATKLGPYRDPAEGVHVIDAVVVPPKPRDIVPFSVCVNSNGHQYFLCTKCGAESMLHEIHELYYHGSTKWLGGYCMCDDLNEGHYHPTCSVCHCHPIMRTKDSSPTP